jgi:hypothetical protein
MELLFMTKLVKAIGSMLKNATLVVCLFQVTLVILSSTLISRTLATALLLSGSSVVIMGNATTISVLLLVLRLVLSVAMVLRILRTFIVRRTVLSFGDMFFVLGSVPNGLVIYP